MNGIVSGLETGVIVLLAFSALVFVHELGHFLAALIVGVRVERFYIGFDAWGMGLKRTINGVECGIGVLPLGGYVKLAGQADDPREEKVTGAPDELRSKPLWAQGLVFISGVVMNFIFGFLVLVIAFLHGISFVPPVIGEVVPDSPAANAGIQVGDRITHIDGKPMPSFEKMQHYIVGRPGRALEYKVKRPGKKDPFTVRIKSERNMTVRGQIATIGVAQRVSRRVGAVVDQPEYRDLAGVFELDDIVINVDGTEIPEHRGHLVQRLVEKRPLDSVSVTVLRDGEEKTFDARVIPVGMYDTGFRFSVLCQDVAEGGPAWKAGLRPGDRIFGVQKKNAKPILFKDHTGLQKAVKGAGLHSVDLTVLRNGEEILIDEITPAFMGSDKRIKKGQDTLLGIAVEPVQEGEDVRVTKVLDDGPSAGKLQEGDILLKASGPGLPEGNSADLKADILGKQIDEISTKELTLLVLKSGKPTTSKPVTMALKPQSFRSHGVPRIGIILATDYVVTGLVKRTESGEKTLASHITVPVGSRVRLLVAPDLVTTYVDWKLPGESWQRTIQATPEYILSDPLAAGFEGRLPVVLYTDRELRQAPSLPAAIVMAGNESLELMTTVYTFIYGLASTEIHISAAGGPISVFGAIKTGTETGLGYLLWIVAFISINLAVFNLLPFPVLDGGHILFLIIEAIKGSPPSEMVREISQYIGIFCLLALMLTVTGIDIFYFFQ